MEEQKKEGVRLYKKVNRQNVMITVPSTVQGFLVIEELIAAGIHVNATLLFALKQYEQTARAYLNGLKRLKESGGDISKIHSVASVFVSRVDSVIDPLLKQKMVQAKDRLAKDKITALLGKAAVANCRIIFEKYKELFSSDEFIRLQSAGANTQRVLWGSTSTKSPEYSDIKYVTELITRPTVNTVPEPTLKAFLDHGSVQEAFNHPAEESLQVIDQLSELGIHIADVNNQLLIDGCAAFDEAFEGLLKSVEDKASALIQK